MPHQCPHRIIESGKCVDCNITFHITRSGFWKNPTLIALVILLMGALVHLYWFPRIEVQKEFKVVERVIRVSECDVAERRRIADTIVCPPLECPVAPEPVVIYKWKYSRCEKSGPKCKEYEGGKIIRSY